MAKVEIVSSLFLEIKKKFKGEAHKIVDLLETLEGNPHKGKIVGNVGSIVIKELKYEGLRFCFIIDGKILKVISKGELVDFLIRFARMSKKKNQQRVIHEIKSVLSKIGDNGF